MPSSFLAFSSLLLCWVLFSLAMVVSTLLFPFCSLLDYFSTLVVTEVKFWVHQISFNQAPEEIVESGSVHKHLPCQYEFGYRTHVKMPGVMVHLCNPNPRDVENEDLWSVNLV